MRCQNCTIKANIKLFMALKRRANWSQRKKELDKIGATGYVRYAGATGWPGDILRILFHLTTMAKKSDLLHEVAFSKRGHLVMPTRHEGLEIGDSSTTRLSLDDIFFDWDIYPRAKIDDFTEEKYCNDLFNNGIKLPYPKVEQIGESAYRVIDGVHTINAFKRRREMHRLQDAGEHIGDPLPDISDENLNTVLCLIEEIPEDEDRMLHSARHNMKHGKALGADDYKKVARHLYTKWFGAPVTKVAGELGIRWETTKGFVADMVADYDRQRAELILKLDMEAKTQEEIGRLGREKYPHGTGWSQESISKFLAEHQNGTAKAKKNGSGKLPKPDNGKGSGEAVRVTRPEEEEQPDNGAKKEALRVIHCEESCMTTGIQYLHQEVRDTYLRALTKLTEITWAKELRFREKLRKSENTVS